MCKLPLFDYKASGCLAFYHLRLIDVIGHKELQTNVFHSFREIGNAVICFLLIEEGQVSQCRQFLGAIRCKLEMILFVRCFSLLYCIICVLRVDDVTAFRRPAKRRWTLSCRCRSSAAFLPSSEVCECAPVLFIFDCHRGRKPRGADSPGSRADRVHEFRESGCSYWIRGGILPVHLKIPLIFGASSKRSRSKRAFSRGSGSAKDCACSRPSSLASR